MSTKFYAGQKDYIEKLNQLDDAFGAAIDAVPAGAANATQTAADRAQTGQDRVATGQDKAATTADRTQTAADRVGTGQDKTATAADRVATGQDRVQTGQDKAATAADRVATGQDRTATAADRVQTGLDRVQTTADRAQTGNDRIQTQADRAAVILERQTVVESREAIDAAVVTFPAQVSSVSSALSNALAIYGSISNLNAATAIVLGYANTAKGAVSQAQAMAAQAASVAQQDLSGVINGALHRSPNTVVAQAIYDTSKDSDGGAWREKCSNLSYVNEALNGMYISNGDALNGLTSEFDARCAGGTFGANLLTDSTWNKDDVSVTVTDGVLTWTASPNGKSAYQAIATLKPNTAYRVQFVIESISSGALYPQFFAGTYPTGSVGQQVTAKGTYVMYLRTPADVANNNIGLSCATMTTAKASMVVSEVLTFAQSGAFYQRATDGKFYRLFDNLLHASRSLNDTAFWAREGAVALVSSSVADPMGGMTAQRFTMNGQCSIYQVQNGIVEGGAKFAAAVYVRGNAGETARAYLQTGGGTYQAQVANFTCTGQWQQIVIDTLTLLDSKSFVGLFIDNASSTATSIDVWDAQMRLGSTVPTFGEVKGPFMPSQVETFRGNTAKFPRLAGIVAEETNVTVYALDQPGCPMWMRFVQNGFASMMGEGTHTSLAAGQGRIVLGATLDMYVADFALDRGVQYSNYEGITGVYRGGIAQRNGGVGHDFYTGLPNIASRTVYGVSMTTLPDAPVDPVTGLQVPTIAVATAAGVSVIHNNGTVVNSNHGGSVSQVTLTPYALVFSNLSVAAYNYVLKPAQLAANFASAQVSIIGGGGAGFANGLALRDVKFANRSMLGGRYDTSLALMRFNESNPSLGQGAQIGQTYNTGWMTGDIRRAVLADTMVGAVSGAELVTNGAWDGTAGWEIESSAVEVSTSIGRLTGTCGPATNQLASQVVSTVPGRTYAVVMQRVSGSSGAYVVSTAGVVLAGLGTVKVNGACVVTFTAVEATTSLRIVTGSGGLTLSVGTVSVKECAADRSYKDSPAVVSGVLSRTAVAAAAQCVAYAGWSNDLLWLPTELVPNGRFDSDISGWTPVNGAAVAWDAGRIAVTPAEGATYGAAQTDVTHLVPGGTYVLTFDVSGASNNVQVNGQIVAPPSARSGVGFSYVFTAASTARNISLVVHEVTGVPTYFDNVSAKALSAIGSAANVLQEAYNPDLDFYTGGFNLCAWVSLLPNYTNFPSDVVEINSAPTTWNVEAGWANNGDGSYTANNTALAFYKSLPAVGTGRVLRVTLTISGWTSGSFKLFCRGGTSVPFSGNGVKTLTVVAGLTSDSNLYIGGYGYPITATVSNVSVRTLAPAWAVDRSGPSGAYYRIGCTAEGRLVGEVSDSINPVRTVASPGSYVGVGFVHGALQLESNGTLALKVNGHQVAQTTGTPMLSLSNASALFTVGNSRTLDAAFPGQITLVRVGATVPTPEQAVAAYEDEKHMFREGAQVTLPDSGALTDLSYDSRSDTWLTASAAYEAAFNGLIRSSATPVSVGAISKIAGGAGVKTVSRSGTNSGVDVTVPAQNLKEELQRRNEGAKATPRERAFDFDATAGQTEFALPVGWEAMEVIAARTPQREGSTKDWTRKFDGFRETVSFAAGQAFNTWVQIIARKV